MSKLDATIADLRIAMSLPPVGDDLLVPAVRVVELLDEIERQRAELDRVHSALRHEADAHATERGRLRARITAVRMLCEGARSLAADSTRIDADVLLPSDVLRALDGS